MFLRELGKPTERMNQPLPDGYMYIRRGTSFVYVYHNKTLLGKCDSLEEAREAIIQHSKGNCVRHRSRTSIELRRAHSIERIDNNRGYSPSNCRWATRSEQNKNTRSNRWLMVDGKKMTITDAAAALGVARGTIRYWLNKPKPNKLSGRVKEIEVDE